MKLLFFLSRRLRSRQARLSIVPTINVAFRSAKVAHFRGAKGDYETLIHRTNLRAYDIFMINIRSIAEWRRSRQ